MPTECYISRREYHDACTLLGIEPLADPFSSSVRAAHLPRWWSPALIATEAARGKLADWARRTPRAEWMAPLDPAAVLTTMQHFGDDVLQHTVARTIAALPRPLADYILETATLVSIGGSLRGWCSPPLPHDRSWLVVCSAHAAPAMFKAIVRHECCHAWLLDPPSPGDCCPRSFVADTISHTPKAHVPRAALAAVRTARAAEARAEVQCIALVHALGYADPSDLPEA